MVTVSKEREVLLHNASHLVRSNSISPCTHNGRKAKKNEKKTHGKGLPFAEAFAEGQLATHHDHHHVYMNTNSDGDTETKQRGKETIFSTQQQYSEKICMKQWSTGLQVIV